MEEQLIFLNDKLDRVLHRLTIGVLSEKEIARMQVWSRIYETLVADGKPSQYCLDGANVALQNFDNTFTS